MLLTHSLHFILSPGVDMPALVGLIVFAGLFIYIKVTNEELAALHLNRLAGVPAKDQKRLHVARRHHFPYVLKRTV